MHGSIKKTMAGRTLDLPVRQKKPRSKGITAITDLGVPVMGLRAILESYHGLIDIAKLGIGTAYVEPLLQEKIGIYKEYEIPVYFGGTLFEKYCHQNRLDDYIRFLRNLDIKTIEVASGIIDLTTEKTEELIRKLKKEFTVLAEVGKKSADHSPEPEEWIAKAKAFLDAGCRYVILEGRNSADTGIYDSSGALDHVLVRKILENLDRDSLIFEAPTAESQSQVINEIGSNVNIGNVCTGDLLLVESLRLGLREETFFI